MLYIPNQTYDAVLSTAPVLLGDPNGEIRIGEGRYKQVGESYKVKDGYIPRIDGVQLNRCSERCADSIFNIVQTQEDVKRIIEKAIA